MNSAILDAIFEEASNKELHFSLDDDYISVSRIKSLEELWIILSILRYQDKFDLFIETERKEDGLEYSISGITKLSKEARQIQDELTKELKGLGWQ